MVTYKPNRAVTFPAPVMHYGDAPHRKFGGLRISLAYKLWRVNEWQHFGMNGRRDLVARSSLLSGH